MASHSSIITWRIPLDRSAWWATVHGVTKSQTRLSDLTLLLLGLAVVPRKKTKLKRFKPEHLIGGTKGTQGKHYHVSDLSPQCFDFFSLYTHLPDHDLSSPITLLY